MSEQAVYTLCFEKLQLQLSCDSHELNEVSYPVCAGSTALCREVALQNVAAKLLSVGELWLYLGGT